MMEDIDLICPQCGNSFPAEEEFCPAHGVSLIAKPPVDKASQEAPQDVPETAEDGSACDGDTPTQEPSAAPDHRAHADHDATVDPLENSRLGKLIKVLRLKGFRPRQPPPQEVEDRKSVV